MWVTVHLLFRERNLEFVEKVALSVGISLALIPLIGLTLNYTPFRIKLIPVVSLLLLVVVLWLVKAARRFLKERGFTIKIVRSMLYASE